MEESSPAASRSGSLPPGVGTPEESRPPPSPLSGAYLLVIISEPQTDAHKAIILQKLAKAFLSWNTEASGIDIERELAIVTALCPEGDFAKNGERLIQNASEHLVTEILIHPQVNTMRQCIRNLLSSFTKYRFIIHSGYAFCGNGSWILQDGTFSTCDFIDTFQEIEVQRVIRAYEKTVKIDICCISEGTWNQSRINQEPFTKICQVEINPSDKISPGNVAVREFVDYLEKFMTPTSIQELLEPSDIVGNIRFTHPTLYVFPGGEGDAALFGINGFNMLVDGGFSRKACFWNFVRHLDRLDGVLLTRINNSNMGGMSGIMQRKVCSHVYPQIGHFFSNLLTKRNLPSLDGDKDKEPLLVNLIDEGHKMVLNLKKLELKPHHCYRDPNSEPINLYHKVGHGKLDMYVISPAKDSKEVKEFLSRWNNYDVKLFSSTSKSGSRELRVPLQNLVSICALLVWQPANPEDHVTRILFPGSAPQHKIFEGFEKMKQLEFLKNSVCTMKSITPVSMTVLKKQKITSEVIIDSLHKGDGKNILGENEVDAVHKPVVELKKPKPRKLIEKAVPKEKSEIKTAVPKAVEKTADNNDVTISKMEEKKKVEVKKIGPKPLPERKLKPPISLGAADKKSESEKSSPTTPKRTVTSTKVTSEIMKEATTKPSQEVPKSHIIKPATETKPIPDTKDLSTKSTLRATKEQTQSKEKLSTKEPAPVKEPIMTKDHTLVKEQTSKASTDSAKTVVRSTNRIQTPPKVFHAAKSLKDENNRKVAEAKRGARTRTPPKIMPVSKPAAPKKDEDISALKTEKKPMPIKKPRLPAKVPSTQSSAPVAVKKVVPIRPLKADEAKKNLKKDIEKTDSSTVSTPSTLDADAIHSLVHGADSLEIKKVGHEMAETLAPTDEDLKQDTNVTTYVSNIYRKEGRSLDDDDDEILVIETTEMKQISQEEQKYLRDEKESEKKKEQEIEPDEGQKLIDKRKSLAIDTDVNLLTQGGQTETKTSDSALNKDLLTPEEKDKISNEVEGIITTATKLVNFKDSDAKSIDDDQRRLEVEKDEKMAFESASTTTAPTMPEDEKVDDIKQEIEEKYDKEETKERSAETKPELELIRKGHKVEETRKSVSKKDVKTPDEVADLPVDDEAEANLQHEERDKLHDLLGQPTIMQPVTDIVELKHAEYVTITPTPVSSPDEKPSPSQESPDKNLKLKTSPISPANDQLPIKYASDTLKQEVQLDQTLESQELKKEDTTKVNEPFVPAEVDSLVKGPIEKKLSIPTPKAMSFAQTILQEEADRISVPATDILLGSGKLTDEQKTSTEKSANEEYTIEDKRGSQSGIQISPKISPSLDLTSKSSLPSHTIEDEEENIDTSRKSSIVDAVKSDNELPTDQGKSQLSPEDITPITISNEEKLVTPNMRSNDASNQIIDSKIISPEKSESKDLGLKNNYTSDDIESKHTETISSPLLKQESSFDQQEHFEKLSPIKIESESELVQKDDSKKIISFTEVTDEANTGKHDTRNTLASSDKILIASESLPVKKDSITGNVDEISSIHLLKSIQKPSLTEDEAAIDSEIVLQEKLEDMTTQSKSPDTVHDKIEFGIIKKPKEDLSPSTEEIEDRIAKEVSENIYDSQLNQEFLRKDSIKLPLENEHLPSTEIAISTTLHTEDTMDGEKYLRKQSITQFSPSKSEVFEISSKSSDTGLKVDEKISRNKEADTENLSEAQRKHLLSESTTEPILKDVTNASMREKKPSLEEKLPSELGEVSSEHETSWPDEVSNELHKPEPVMRKLSSSGSEDTKSQTLLHTESQTDQSKMSKLLTEKSETEIQGRQLEEQNIMFERDSLLKKPVSIQETPLESKSLFPIESLPYEDEKSHIEESVSKTILDEKLQKSPERFEKSESALIQDDDIHPNDSEKSITIALKTQESVSKDEEISSKLLDKASPSKSTEELSPTKSADKITISETQRKTSIPTDSVSVAMSGKSKDSNEKSLKVDKIIDDESKLISSDLSSELRRRESDMELTQSKIDAVQDTMNRKDSLSINDIIPTSYTKTLDQQDNEKQSSPIAPSPELSQRSGSDNEELFKSSIIIDDTNILTTESSKIDIQPPCEDHSMDIKEKILQTDSIDKELSVANLPSQADKSQPEFLGHQKESLKSDLDASTEFQKHDTPSPESDISYDSKKSPSDKSLPISSKSLHEKSKIISQTGSELLSKESTENLEVEKRKSSLDNVEIEGILKPQAPEEILSKSISQSPVREKEDEKETVEKDSYEENKAFDSTSKDEKVSPTTSVSVTNKQKLLLPEVSIEERSAPKEVIFTKENEVKTSEIDIKLSLEKSKTDTTSERKKSSPSGTSPDSLPDTAKDISKQHTFTDDKSTTIKHTEGPDINQKLATAKYGTDKSAEKEKSNIENEDQKSKAADYLHTQEKEHENSSADEVTSSKVELSVEAEAIKTEKDKTSPLFESDSNTPFTKDKSTFESKELLRKTKVSVDIAQEVSEPIHDTESSVTETKLTSKTEIPHAKIDPTSEKLKLDKASQDQKSVHQSAEQHTSNQLIDSKKNVSPPESYEDKVRFPESLVSEKFNKEDSIGETKDEHEVHQPQEIKEKSKTEPGSKLTSPGASLSDDSAEELTKIEKLPIVSGKLLSSDEKGQEKSPVEPEGTGDIKKIAPSDLQSTNESLQEQSTIYYDSIKNIDESQRNDIVLANIEILSPDDSKILKEVALDIKSHEKEQLSKVGTDSPERSEDIKITDLQTAPEFIQEQIEIHDDLIEKITRSQRNSIITNKTDTTGSNIISQESKEPLSKIKSEKTEPINIDKIGDTQTTDSQSPTELSIADESFKKQNKIDDNLKEKIIKSQSDNNTSDSKKTMSPADTEVLGEISAEIKSKIIIIPNIEKKLDDTITPVLQAAPEFLEERSKSFEELGEKIGEFHPDNTDANKLDRKQIDEIECKTEKLEEIRITDQKTVEEFIQKQTDIDENLKEQIIKSQRSSVCEKPDSISPVDSKLLTDTSSQFESPDKEPIIKSQRNSISDRPDNISPVEPELLKDKSSELKSTDENISYKLSSSTEKLEKSGTTDPQTVGKSIQEQTQLHDNLIEKIIKSQRSSISDIIEATSPTDSQVLKEVLSEIQSHKKEYSDKVRDAENLEENKISNLPTAKEFIQEQTRIHDNLIEQITKSQRSSICDEIKTVAPTDSQVLKEAPSMSKSPEKEHSLEAINDTKISEESKPIDLQTSTEIIQKYPDTEKDEFIETITTSQRSSIVDDKIETVSPTRTEILEKTSPQIQSYTRDHCGIEKLESKTETTRPIDSEILKETHSKINSNEKESFDKIISVEKKVEESKTSDLQIAEEFIQEQTEILDVLVEKITKSQRSGIVIDRIEKISPEDSQEFKESQEFSDKQRPDETKSPTSPQILKESQTKVVQDEKDVVGESRTDKIHSEKLGENMIPTTELKSSTIISKNLKSENSELSDKPVCHSYDSQILKDSPTDHTHLRKKSFPDDKTHLQDNKTAQLKGLHRHTSTSIRPEGYSIDKSAEEITSELILENAAAIEALNKESFDEIQVLGYSAQEVTVDNKDMAITSTHTSEKISSSEKMSSEIPPHDLNKLKERSKESEKLTEQPVNQNKTSPVETCVILKQKITLDEQTLQFDKQLASKKDEAASSFLSTQTEDALKDIKDISIHKDTIQSRDSEKLESISDRFATGATSGISAVIKSFDSQTVPDENNKIQAPRLQEDTISPDESKSDKSVTSTTTTVIEKCPSKEITNADQRDAEHMVAQITTADIEKLKPITSVEKIETKRSEDIITSKEFSKEKAGVGEPVIEKKIRIQEDETELYEVTIEKAKKETLDTQPPQKKQAKETDDENEENIIEMVKDFIYQERMMAEMDNNQYDIKQDECDVRSDQVLVSHSKDQADSIETLSRMDLDAHSESLLKDDGTKQSDITSMSHEYGKQSRQKEISLEQQSDIAVSETSTTKTHKMDHDSMARQKLEDISKDPSRLSQSMYTSALEDSKGFTELTKEITSKKDSSHDTETTSTLKMETTETTFTKSEKNEKSSESTATSVEKQCSSHKTSEEKIEEMRNETSTTTKVTYLIGDDDSISEELLKELEKIEPKCEGTYTIHQTEKDSNASAERITEEKLTKQFQEVTESPLRTFTTHIEETVTGIASDAIKKLDDGADVKELIREISDQTKSDNLETTTEYYIEKYYKEPSERRTSGGENIQDQFCSTTYVTTTSSAITTDDKTYSTIAVISGGEGKGDKDAGSNVETITTITTSSPTIRTSTTFDRRGSQPRGSVEADESCLPISPELQLDATQMRVKFTTDRKDDDDSKRFTLKCKSNSEEFFDSSSNTQDVVGDLSSQFVKREPVVKTVSLPILDEKFEDAKASVEAENNGDFSRSYPYLEKISNKEIRTSTNLSDPTLTKQVQGELQSKSVSLPVIKRPDESEQYMTLPHLYKTNNLEDLRSNALIKTTVASSQERKESDDGIETTKESVVIGPIKETEEPAEDTYTFVKTIRTFIIDEAGETETTTVTTTQSLDEITTDKATVSGHDEKASSPQQDSTSQSDISPEKSAPQSQIARDEQSRESVKSPSTTDISQMSASMMQSFYGSYPDNDSDDDHEKSENKAETNVTQSRRESSHSAKKDPISDWGKPLRLPDERSMRTLLVWNPLEDWGKPLGLPSPTPTPIQNGQHRESNGDIEITLAPVNTKGTPKRTAKKPSEKNTTQDTSKNRDSSAKKTKSSKQVNPLYVDLAYVPHHGNPYYTTVEFFKRIRARYYVFSGTDPNKDVFNALLEGKKSWENQDLEVTIISTYDTDVLGYWITENEETLANLRIDLAPSASRCTINLQDHDTSCSAYRLEF